MSARVASVQVGRVAPLGPERVPSGIVKHPVEGPVAVARLGLAGDEQADLSVHGGPDKAVYGYAAAHYPLWAAEHPHLADRLDPGAFGENLTIEGLDEADICVGDVHAIGTARLQVCQPRQPCYKFALRLGDARAPKAMVRSGRAGWYYRVIAEGALQAGDAVELVERPHPDLAFARLVEIINFGVATPEELTALAAAPGVADWLRAQAKAALG
ncbi:MAG: hypothetical protein A4S12_02760 [Proteobacteria bacterium SG_bin5]|nr:MAG: hypothetical protein A4S12_02760 [Proteobacteria bacterium SG_bin5]